MSYRNFSVLIFSIALPLCLFTTAPAQTKICDSSLQRKLSLSITDKDGVFVRDLKPSDLVLTIDKKPITVFNLDPKLEQPLAVVILFDTSMSQDASILESKLAAQKFIQAILRPKLDRAAVVSFAGEPTLEQDLTNDTATLLRAIGNLKVERAPEYVLNGTAGQGSPPIQSRRQGTTAMWDAIWASTDDVLQYVDNSRRVVLLLTDGEDSSSESRWRETIEHAALNDVEVFSIEFTKLKFNVVGEQNLGDLTEATGGRAFFAKKVQEIPDILTKIEQYLRSQYVVQYCLAGPPAAPFKLKLELRNQQLESQHPRLLYPRLAR